MYVLDEPDPHAVAAIEALPADALRRLADVYKVLTMAPWNGTPLRSGNPNGNMLTMPFGERGLVTYLVFEDERRVFVVRVQWI